MSVARLAAWLVAVAIWVSPQLARAQGGECDAEPPLPFRLADKAIVQSYTPVLKLCSAGSERKVAVREMQLGDKAALLVADPETLRTELQWSSCWTCRDVDENEIADTRLMRSIVKSAEAPGLTKRGFLENAGLTHGAGDGLYLTGDLCPSTKPLERAFFTLLADKGPHTPVALSISGLWLTHHFADYRWLVERQAEGAIDIVWTNHTYHHQFKRGMAPDRNFMLTPGVDADAEILDTERLLIANGQTPSLFFRFPGLISSAPLMQTARQRHLISLGADAWLALRQQPRPGSIVLVHPNGNEPAGLRIFARDDAEQRLPKPLEALTNAPQ